MSFPLFFAAALAAASPPPSPTPMPTGDALAAQVADRDAALFWAMFEGCNPAALPDLLAPDYRMLHDKDGLAIASRDAFVAAITRQCASRAPGGDNAGYRNRRLAIPGTRTVRAMGDWGALEDGAHAFFEWNAADARWDMVGGARYTHLWQWIPAEGRFRLSQSYSFDHGAAAPYPPADR